MADKKISALTGATTPLAGTEVLPIVQSGSTVKVSVANLTVGRAVAMAGGSFTDSITQSTSAKGINFTANTPAAGMTSQLLNWYEEGTFAPNQGSGLTVVGAFSSDARYVRVGRQITINGYVAGATSISVATGGQMFTNLPFTAGLSCTGIIGGYTGGTSSAGFVSNGSTTFSSIEAIGAVSYLFFAVIYIV